MARVVVEAVQGTTKETVADMVTETVEDMATGTEEMAIAEDTALNVVAGMVPVAQEDMAQAAAATVVTLTLEMGSAGAINSIQRREHTISLSTSQLGTQRT